MKIKTIIEAAAIEDIPGLAKIENLCFTTDKISNRQFRYLMHSPSAKMVTAKVNNDIAGYAVILFRKNSKSARLYSLAITPSFRKQGIAHELCRYIETLSIKQGCNQLILEVRKSADTAIHFYIKNGYEKSGEYTKFYEDGEDAIRMKKYLPDMELIKADRNFNCN